MRLWLGISKDNTASCPGCKEPITPGTLTMSVSQRRGKDNVSSSWHPECLLRYSRKVLATGPAMMRKLTVEERATRLSMLRQFAANKQRITYYRSRLPNQVLEYRISRLLALQQLLRIRIVEVGGLPKRWVLDYVDKVAS